jgi:hypothetical protein
MPPKNRDGAIFMLLGKGGHREDGAEVQPGSWFYCLCTGRDLERAQNEALAALQERNWHGVELLRAGEVAERPAQEPHGTAWLEANEGRRGIIVYQEAGTGDEGQGEG